jgi:cell division protein FtsB
LVICLAAVSVLSNRVEIKTLREESEFLMNLIEEEKNKQVLVESQKHYYESDSFIEKFAREKLGLVKSNDVLYMDRDR